MDKLEVVVESHSDNRGLLGLDHEVSAALIGLRAKVHIRATNASKMSSESIVRWGDAHSPVACTLRSAIATEIEMVVSDLNLPADGQTSS